MNCCWVHASGKKKKTCVVASSPRRTIHHLAFMCATGLILFLLTAQNYPRPIPLSAFFAGVALVDGVFAEDRGDSLDHGLDGNRYAR